MTNTQKIAFAFVEQLSIYVNISDWIYENMASVSV